MADAPRKARNAAKVFASWLVGFITDPHTRATSAAKISGLIVVLALAGYLVICARKGSTPDAATCGIFSGLITACLALRPRATQESKLPSRARAEDQAHAPLPPLAPGES